MIDIDLLRAYIYGDILHEIHRQDEKWGIQSHDFPTWVTILGEEFGEACQEVLNIKNAENLELIIDSKKRLDEELVQVIAVCFRIIEKIRDKNANS
jgi:hypothetical protein